MRTTGVLQGFDETTVEAIVEAAGTSRRTFFRYFESKRDLIAQPVKDPVTPHVFAALTVPALRISYRVWFSAGKNAKRLRRLFAILTPEETL